MSAQSTISAPFTQKGEPWAYYNDNDKAAAAWLRELVKGGHIAPGEVDERSLLDVQPEDVSGFTQCHFFAGIGGWSLALRLAGWPDSRTVWTGSPPCQPFSSAGRHEGKDDERHLSPHFVNLVRACRPGVLFGEQVANAAVFGKAAKSARNRVATEPEWAWFDDLSDRLEAALYAVGASDIPSAGVGAPHIRQRTFFGAYDTRLTAGGLVDPELSETARQRQHSRKSLREQEAGGPAGGRLALELGAERSDSWLFRGNGTGALGDPDSAGSLSGPHEGVLRREEGRGPRDGEPERSGGDPRGLAHGEIVGRGEERPLDRGCDERDDPEGRPTGHDSSGSSCRVGDASDEPRQRGAGAVSGTETQEHGARLSVDGCVSVGPEYADEGVGRRLGDPELLRRDEGIAGDPGETEGARGERGDESDRPGAVPMPSPTNGFWRDADWLCCIDGKWRPVEPGTLPLADGIPGRVGLLRGYGNAINPWVAAEFIVAFEEARSEEGPGDRTSVGAGAAAGDRGPSDVDIDDLLGPEPDLEDLLS